MGKGLMVLLFIMCSFLTRAQRQYREKTLFITEKKTGVTTFVLDRNYLLLLNADRLKIYDTADQKNFQFIKMDNSEDKSEKTKIRWFAVDKHSKECRVIVTLDANLYGGKDTIEIEYDDYILGYSVNEVK